MLNRNLYFTLDQNVYIKQGKSCKNNKILTAYYIIKLIFQTAQRGIL